MKLQQIYDKQYQLAKIKLNEENKESWSDWLDKWQNRADIASLAGAGAGLASTATGVGAPVGAGAVAASTGIDLANAGVYAGRSIYDLAHGDVASAKSHAFDAALRGVFAIPYIGDIAQAGRAAKTAAKAAEVGTEVGAKTATRAARAAEVGTEVAAKEKAAVGATQRSNRRVPLPTERPAKVPPRTPKTPSEVPTRTPTRVPPRRPIVPSEAGVAAKEAEKVGTGLLKGKVAQNVLKAGKVAGGAAIAKIIYDTLTGKGGTKGETEDETGSQRELRVMRDLNPLITGTFDNTLAGYATNPRRDSGMAGHVSSRFRNPWQIDPILASSGKLTSVDSRGRLTENSDEDLSVRVKNAVSAYLKSKQGKDLDKHLDLLKKSIED